MRSRARACLLAQAWPTDPAREVCVREEPFWIALPMSESNFLQARINRVEISVQLRRRCIHAGDTWAVQEACHDGTDAVCADPAPGFGEAWVGRRASVRRTRAGFGAKHGACRSAGGRRALTTKAPDAPRSTM
jgi:hypothetical protein